MKIPSQDERCGSSLTKMLCIILSTTFLTSYIVGSVIERVCQ